MTGLGNKKVMASNIQYYMDKSNISRYDLCDAIGVKYTTLSDWINAKTYPRIDWIEKIANYFGITKADLVEEKNSEDEYYIDPKAAAAAQKMMTNTRLKALFEAAATSSDEDLQTTYNMLMALKRKETHEDE